MNEALIGIITVVVTNLITFRVSIAKTKWEQNSQALQNRYKLLYTPLRALLINVHISTYTISFPLTFKLRMFFRRLRNQSLKEAIRIFAKNYHIKPGYEIEYGEEFPLEQIKKIVMENIEWADSKLLDLLQRIDRSQYEEWQEMENGVLPEDQYRLAMHIHDHYKKLNKRLLPQ